jgi:hypothetical protein
MVHSLTVEFDPVVVHAWAGDRLQQLDLRLLRIERSEPKTRSDNLGRPARSGGRGHMCSSAMGRSATSGRTALQSPPGPPRRARSGRRHGRSRLLQRREASCSKEHRQPNVDWPPGNADEGEIVSSRLQDPPGPTRRPQDLSGGSEQPMRRFRSKPVKTRDQNSQPGLSVGVPTTCDRVAVHTCPFSYSCLPWKTGQWS